MTPAPLSTAPLSTGAPAPVSARRKFVSRSARLLLWLVYASGVWTLGVALFAPRSHVEAYVADSAQAALAPAVETVQTRVLLLGDGGLAEPGSAVLSALASRSRLPAATTLVVFLGDNVYPEGLPPLGHPGRAKAERHLQAQLSPFADSSAELLFLPGNHDWEMGGEQGARAVQRMADWVNAAQVGGSVRFAPAVGSGGVECFDRAGLRLVALDTQWWLQPGNEPSRADFGRRVRECLEQADAQTSLVFGHHPMHTVGQHGGFSDVEDHLFPLTRKYPNAYLPLPVLGSLFIAWRELRPSAQDTWHPTNQALVNALHTAFSARPPLLYAAGHDHNLQVQRATGARYHVVSGAGSRVQGVGNDENTLFAQEQLGFMELVQHTSGEFWLHVHTALDAASQPQPRWQLRLQ